MSSDTWAHETGEPPSVHLPQSHSHTVLVICENHNMHYLRSILKLTKFARIYSVLLNFTIICLWTLALYCTHKKWIAHFRKHQERNWCTLAGFRDSIYSMYVYTRTSVLVYFTHKRFTFRSFQRERKITGNFFAGNIGLFTEINLFFPSKTEELF